MWHNVISVNNFKPIPITKRVDGLNFRVGIEAEIEWGNRDNDGELVDERELQPTPFWTVVRGGDGSLRGSNCEMITTLPPPGGRDILSAIKSGDRLLNYFRLITESAPAPSPRTSTHIHLNMLDREPEEIFEFILACIYTSPDVMTRFFTDDRVDNCFAIPPLVKLPWLARSLGGRGTNYTDKLVRISRNWDKYSQINLTRLLDLGTIELRGYQGITTSFQQLEPYIRYYFNLLQHSINYRVFTQALILRDSIVPHHLDIQYEGECHLGWFKLMEEIRT